MKWQTILLAVLVVLPFVTPCQSQYGVNENVTIIDNIVSWGEGADCNISIYHTNSTLVNSGLMVRTDLAYNYTIAPLPRGTYIAGIECNLSNATFVSECKFQVEGDEKVYIAIGIGLVAIIGLLIYLGLEFRFIGFNFVYGKEDDKKSVQIPFLQYLFWIAAGWISLALIHTTMVADASEGGLMDTTLVSVYSAVLWLMYFLSAMWLIGIIFFVLKYLAGVGKEMRI